MLEPVKCPDCGVWWRSYTHYCKNSSVKINVSGPNITSGSISLSQDPNIIYNVINTYSQGKAYWGEHRNTLTPSSDEPPVGSIVLCGCENVVYFRKYDVHEGWISTDKDEDFTTWDRIFYNHDGDVKFIYTPQPNFDCDPHMYYNDEDTLLMAIKYGTSSGNDALNKKSSQLSWEYWHSFSDAIRNVIIDHVHFSLEMNPKMDWQAWEWLFDLEDGKPI